MLIQLQPQHLAIFELELELPAVEPRIVLVDNPVVIGADDNDVRGVVVLRTSEVVDVVGLDNAVAILVARRALHGVLLQFRLSAAGPHAERHSRGGLRAERGRAVLHG